MSKLTKSIAINELKRRLTSKVTLSLLAAAVFGLLLNLGVLDDAGVAKYTDTFNYIVGILVIVGIVRDPKKPQE